MKLSKFFNHDFSENSEFNLFDKNGNCLYWEYDDEVVFWSRIEYNENNQMIRKECSDGFWSKTEYDSGGNEIGYTNSDDIYKEALTGGEIKLCEICKEKKEGVISVPADYSWPSKDNERVNACNDCSNKLFFKALNSCSDGNLTEGSNIVETTFTNVVDVYQQLEEKYGKHNEDWKLLMQSTDGQYDFMKIKLSNGEIITEKIKLSIYENIEDYMCK